jgi:AMP deaminase
MLSDFEDYRQDRELGYAGSEESWEEGRDHERDMNMLPEAAMEPEDTPPETSTPSDREDGILPRDKQRKTAYYDYATERSLSHADAKLFYQRSQLEAQKTGGSNWGNSQQSPSGSPILVGNGFSLHEADQAGIQRSGSLNSLRGGHHTGQRLVLSCSFSECMLTV